MILAEIRYKTQDNKLLAIFMAFKTRKYSLVDCKYKILVFINHNNLQHFIDTKNLSFKQVYWVQKLLKYHFQIDYYPSKTNRATYTLLQYLQRSPKEKVTFQAENTKIIYRLQSSLI